MDAVALEKRIKYITCCWTMGFERPFSGAL